MLTRIKKFAMLFLLVIFGQVLCSDPRQTGGGASGNLSELTRVDDSSVGSCDDSSDDERLQRLNLPDDVIERLVSGKATDDDLRLVAGIKVDEVVMKPLLAAEEARKAEIAAYLAARKALDGCNNPELSGDAVA